MAERLGLEVDWVPGDWRHGVDPDKVARGRCGTDPSIAAVMVVHNETSTGVTSRVAEIREAIDAAGSDALLLVDTISSLGSIDYRHDEWGVDVTVGCSQKGLMLPAGLGFNAVSEKALAAAERARLPRSYWDWEPIIAANAERLLARTRRRRTCCTGCARRSRCCARRGWRTSSPATSGTPRRRARPCAPGASRSCALDEREYSGALTAVVVPGRRRRRRGARGSILERFDMSLGAGLGKLAGRVFRIGHLGDFNDLMLAGTLCGVEMGLRLAGVPVRARRRGGARPARARSRRARERARRAPDPGADPGDGRAVLRPGARRHGRRRGQGRAAGAATPRASRSAPRLPRRQPQQALAGARPQVRRSTRPCCTGWSPTPTCVLENYRPGVAARLGADWETLSSSSTRG